MRLPLIGSVFLATSLLLPVIPASAYYSAGSVTTFGYQGTSVQTYTNTTPTAPIFAPPVTAPTTSSDSSAGTGSGTSAPPAVTQTTAQPSAFAGSVTYFGTAGPAPAPLQTTTTTPAPASTTQPQPDGTSTSPIAVVGPTSGQTGNPPANEPDLVAQFLTMVNQARAQNGVSPLTENVVLDSCALAKAQDLVMYNYFDHYSPRLGWPINQEEAAGFRAYSMGPENLAEAGSMSMAFAMLMASPLHRENILNTAFTQTGIAIVPVTNGVLIDEMFTGPSY